LSLARHLVRAPARGKGLLVVRLPPLSGDTPIVGRALQGFGRPPLQHVTARIQGDYVGVQFAHTGAGRTFIGSTATSVNATQCCVSPAEALIEFPESFQQVAWRIDRDVLARKLVALIGVPLTRTLDFNSALAIDTLRVSSLSAILHCILVHLTQSHLVGHPFVLEELEQALIVSLLCNGEHNFRHLLDGDAPTAAPRQVRLVEDYIEANWEKPFRIEEMVAITGSSIRSIYRAFNSNRGYSPMEFVKRQRLIQACRLLQNPDSVMTVTRVAFACGFSDVSRFSKDFSKAYGESPSAVRNRLKSR